MKKTTNKKNNDVLFEMVNKVTFNGKVKNVLASKEKVAIYNIEIPSGTKNGNISKAWVKVVDFDKEFEFEEGDAVAVSGSLNTNSFDGKNGKVFETRVIAESISPLE